MTERPATDPALPPPQMQSPEQLSLATWLERGTRVGLALLVTSFLAYVTGLLPSSVPVEQLPEVWSLPLAEYLERSGTPIGWAWVLQIGDGDLSCLAGIAVLAGCAMPGLAALVPLFRRGGERSLAWICVAEAVVLALAASGLIAGSH